MYEPNLEPDVVGETPCDNDGCTGTLLARCSGCGAPTCCTVCCAAKQPDAEGMATEGAVAEEMNLPVRGERL